MGHELDPNSLQSWTPYAIGTLLFLVAGYLGYAIRWGSTKGVDAFIKWREYRAKERAAYSKEREELNTARVVSEQKKKLIDKFIEGKLTTEGYRALLLLYDQRLQDLEAKDKEKTASLILLNQQLSECLQTHAADKEAIKGLNSLIQEMRDKQTLLEQQCLGFQRKLQRGSASDSYPSPPLHIPPQQPLSEGESNG